MLNNFTNNRLILPLIFGLFGVCLSGCISIVVPADAKELSSPGRYSLMFDVSEHVLKSYSFTIERSDRRLGRINTNLVTSKSFFEFWRKDTASVMDTLEGSLQGIYRSAEVGFEPKSDPDRGWDIVVSVNVYRSEHVEPTISGASQAYSLYSQNRGSRKQRMKESVEGVVPIKAELIDTDSALAAKIRQEIISELEDLLGMEI